MCENISAGLLRGLASLFFLPTLIPSREPTAELGVGNFLQVGTVNEEELKLLMRTVDRDHSGTIQFDELGKALLPQ